MKNISINRVIAVSWLVLTLLAGLTLPANAAPSAHPLKPLSQPGDEALQQRAFETYARLPLYFVANRGQLDERVGYYVQGGGHAIYFTAEEMVMALPQTTLRLRFVGANAATQLLGAEKRAAKVNYFIGNDPQKWRTDIPTYGEAVYRDLYPGIDLRYAGQTGALKYTFVVHPGADVSQIRLAYQGADALSLDERGDLVIQAAGGELRDTRPYVYQEIGGRQVEVETAFALYDWHVYGFAVQGDYDPRHPLVIDPVLLYSTYLGGSGDDKGWDIAVDEAGHAYVTGETTSLLFPTKNYYDNSLGDGTDAFVTKIDTTQSGAASLVYSTYLGGTTSSDYSYGIAVDGAGHAYVTGVTYSSDFPYTVNAYDNALEEMDDAFVTKLNPAGNALLYSTYLGGDSSDEGDGIAVDEAGQAYVTGYTYSSNFPRKNAYDTTLGGSMDAFVTKIDTTQSGTNSLAYSTYLGGSSSDEGYGIAVGGADHAYVTGLTGSSDFPPKNAYDITLGGGVDAFVTRIDTTQSGPASLLYSTFLGGSSSEYGKDIAIDGAGHVYVTGSTYSADFPPKNAYDTTLGGGVDAFVTKMDTAQSGAASLLYSTYLGGTGGEEGYGIAVDWAHNAYVTGYADSTGFPLKDQYQGHQGLKDVFVTRFTAAGNDVIYSTYLGGGDNDQGYGIAVDGAGHAYVTGETWSSPDFPTQNPYQAANGGGVDAFVAKLGMANNTILNPDTGLTYLGIQAGINAALPGQKVLAYSGSYNEDVTLLSGVGVYGQGLTRPVLNGTGAGSVVRAEGGGIGPNTVIAGFRITGGKPLAGGVMALAQGGGVYVNNASPNIENNVIEGNSSSSGGGIYVGSGDPNISNNTVQGNNANGGGGIYVGGGNPNISNNTVQNNDSTNPGGGIYIGGGDPNISNNTIQGNHSDGNGGGIYVGTGTPDIFNNVVQGNSANAAGGGIYVDSIASPTVISNTLCGNTNFNLYKNGASLNAPGNWWGTNSPISGTDYNANVNPAPVVYLDLSIEPPAVQAGDTATVTVRLLTSGYKAADGTAISLTIVSGGTFPGSATTIVVNTTNGLASATVNVTSDDGVVIRAVSPYNNQVVIVKRLGSSRVYLPSVLKEP